ncbi:hypothetical protein H0H92_010823 [Tricholoma furcatifolium]|nr:hypothetical protein H0H92_010823 [Tricholoma furcatifolium]
MSDRESGEVNYFGVSQHVPAELIERIANASASPQQPGENDSTPTQGSRASDDPSRRDEPSAKSSTENRGANPSSTAGRNDRNETGTGYDAELGKKQDEVVRQFAEGRITKADAALEINTIINGAERMDSQQRRLAFAAGLAELDATDEHRRASIRRGKRVSRGMEQRGWDSNEEFDGDDEVEKTRQDFEEIEINDGGKRTRDLDESEEELDEDKVQKKRKISRTELPWFHEEELAIDAGRTSCKKTQKLLRLYARDPQWVRREIIISGSVAEVQFSSRTDPIFKD